MTPEAPQHFAVPPQTGLAEHWPALSGATGRAVVSAHLHYQPGHLDCSAGAEVAGRAAAAGAVAW